MAYYGIGNINGVGYNQNPIQATKQQSSVDKEKLVNSNNEDNPNTSPKEIIAIVEDIRKPTHMAYLPKTLLYL
jgi:hypothetical protein